MFLIIQKIKVTPFWKGITSADKMFYFSFKQ